VWFYGPLVAGIAGSNPSGTPDVCILGLLCVVRRGPCDGTITCPEESYRLFCV
jgi:hypothetical protein